MNSKKSSIRVNKPFATYVKVGIPGSVASLGHSAYRTYKEGTLKKATLKDYTEGVADAFLMGALWPVTYTLFTFASVLVGSDKAIKYFMDMLRGKCN